MADCTCHYTSPEACPIPYHKTEPPTDIEQALAEGTRVRLMLPVQLAMLGLTYPREGVIKQYIADYPDGPAYAVAFHPENDPPVAYFLAAWVVALGDDDE